MPITTTALKAISCSVDSQYPDHSSALSSLFNHGFYSAYISHGPEWKKIEPLVLRSAADCKDRWTKQLDPKLAGVDKGSPP
jgi:hypothetical protein